MPPPTDLAVPVDLDGLHVFFDPGSMLAGFDSEGWDLHEMIKILVEIAKDGKLKPADRMQAIRMLDSKTKEVHSPPERIVATEIVSAGSEATPATRKRSVEVLRGTSSRMVQAIEQVEEASNVADDLQKFEEDNNGFDTRDG